MTELSIYRANEAHGPDSQAAGTIAICTRGDVKTGTAISWLMTDYSFLGPDQYVGRYFIEGNVLTMQRNACINEMEGDWLVFIDDDMSFQPDAIGRLVKTAQKTGADMVGGLCFQRGEPYQPTLYRARDNSGYTFVEDWEPGEVVEVDATGLAFALITTQALRKIIAFSMGDDFESVQWPPREFRKVHPGAFFAWDNEWGEDFAFCRDLKAAGGKIVVDTAIEIGHIGQHTITKETFWREVAFRDRETEEAKRELGKLAGTSTLTREKALERLGSTVLEDAKADWQEEQRLWAIGQDDS